MPIQDGWAIDLDSRDPSIPNLPLETPEAAPPAGVDQVATVAARAFSRRDLTQRRMAAQPVLHLTVQIEASTDAQLATPFQTRLTRSRRSLAVGWMAGMTVQQQTAVIPYPSWQRTPVRRRETMTRRLLTAPALHWRLIAPTVAAILRRPTATVIEFRRTLQLSPPHGTYPPPTGPPNLYPAWAAASIVAPVSQHRRLQRLIDQPVYPATPATESPDRALAAAFETRLSRGRRFLRAPDVIGVDAFTPPGVTPYLDAARSLTRRETARTLAQLPLHLTFPATPIVLVSDVATVVLRPRRTLLTDRRLVKALTAPVYPAPTPPAEVEFAALVQPPRRRRKGRAGLFLSASGDILSIPTPSSSPAVYPSFLVVGFNKRRDTERRFVRVLDAQVYPATPTPEASPDRSLAVAFETRRQRGRRFLAVPSVLGVDAAPPVTSDAPETAYRLPATHTTRFARRLQPAAPQITYPATPEPLATPITAVIAARSIRRRTRPGLFLGGSTSVDGYAVAQPEAAYRAPKALRRAETRRALLAPLALLERPQTPPVPEQPPTAYRLALALRAARLDRRIQSAAPQPEFPETPPVIVIPPVGGDDKPEARKYPGWDKKRATLKRNEELRLAEDITALYRKLTSNEATAERARALVQPVSPDAELALAESRALARQALQAQAQAVEIEIALRLLADELQAMLDEEEELAIAMILAAL